MRDDRDRSSIVALGKLAGAGSAGVVIAVCALYCFAGHPGELHAGWLLAVCGAVWTGLLVVALATLAVDVNPSSVPVRETAWVGVTGLLLALILTLVAPDRYLDWWVQTGPGNLAVEWAGLGGAGFALGLLSGLAVGVVSAVVVTARGLDLRARWWYPAAFLFLLLLPGVLLQTHDDPPVVFALWSVGTAGGVVGGVRLAVSLHW